MERRWPLTALIVALLLLLPAAALAAQPAPPAGPSMRTIQVADDQGVHEFSLVEMLEFLRQDYTDLSAVRDPLLYARHLSLRGRLLAHYLAHTNELARGGFFQTGGAALQRAVAASVRADLIGAEAAATLTPRDILALHAIVYATSGPAVCDEFASRHAVMAALEGRDLAYLGELQRCVLEAREQIGRVRALSGMYGEPEAIQAACASQAQKGPTEGAACAPSPQGEGHKCQGNGEGHQCSGKCSGGGADHKCSGACKAEGGQCSGKCQEKPAAPSPKDTLSRNSIR